MKKAWCLLGMAFILIQPSSTSSQANTPQAEGVRADRAPVIVELFTSEGCSSCPPADALLSKLETNQPIGDAQIIGFEEHVDYWNQDGWVDPFSSPEWTFRQREYVDRFRGNSPFTPQMIVDGRSQLVGNNEKDARASIRAAADRAKRPMEVKAEAAAAGNAQRYDVRVAASAGTGDQEPADVWIAVTESGLGMDVTSGENAGRNLQHGAILRSLHKIGSVSGKDSATFTAKPEVHFKSSWKKENLQVIVFLQERKSLRILGAASTRVAG
jgi:hypothetical protein